MSKFDLDIHFDGNERSWRAGETVKGRVHVRANKNMTCDQLFIELNWETHGKGNKDREQVGHWILGTELDWQKGQDYSYPFSYRLPRGPLTFHGTYINVDYYLRVRADIPWALDTKARKDIIVLPGEPWPEPNRHALSKPRTGLGPVVWLGPLLGLIPAWFLQDHLPLPAIVFISIFIITVCGTLVAINISKRRSEEKLGVTLDLDSLVLRPGGEARLTVNLHPQEGSEIERITATLSGVESCESGSGSDITRHSHVLHNHVFELASGQILMTDQTYEFQSHIPIPQTSAYTFPYLDSWAEANRVVWQLEVNIELSRTFNWTHKIPVQMGP